MAPVHFRLKYRLPQKNCVRALSRFSGVREYTAPVSPKSVAFALFKASSNDLTRSIARTGPNISSVQSREERGSWSKTVGGTKCPSLAETAGEFTKRPS